MRLSRTCSEKTATLTSPANLPRLCVAAVDWRAPKKLYNRRFCQLSARDFCIKGEIRPFPDELASEYWNARWQSRHEMQGLVMQSKFPRTEIDFLCGFAFILSMQCHQTVSMKVSIDEITMTLSSLDENCKRSFEKKLFSWQIENFL